jgi:DNA-binding GntR family transcriptional regulator
MVQSSNYFALMTRTKSVPNSNATLQQQAYEHIKGQIVSLGFKPGQYVADSEIAERLNISRTPVREAFHRLEKEGLLINEARRGWRIYTLSLEDIQEIFDIKVAVEGMVARKAAECQDEQLRDSLLVTLASMQAAADADAPDAWLEADHRLHEILFQMAGNQRARSIVENLNAQWHRVRIGFVALQGRTKRSAEEHQTIVNCILAGDGEGAEARMHAHLNQVRDELVHLLVSIVLPFVEDGV